MEDPRTKAAFGIALAAVVGAMSLVAYYRWRLLSLRGASTASQTGGGAPQQRVPSEKSYISKDVSEPSSRANFSECLVRNVDLEWTVDFQSKRLVGSATLEIELLTKECSCVKLDTKKLDVESVVASSAVSSSTDNSSLEFEPATWELSNTHEVFGECLTVEIPTKTDSLPHQRGDKLLVRIDYKTASGDSCSAAQWLDPFQTQGKRFPYLFTQCQAIHARSLLPCMDAPCVKFTYSASIKISLKGLTALMSAMCVESEQVGAFRFEQKIPVPSYLVALAVGELESRDVGPRSRVWSEPSMVDLAAHEFSQTEDFLRAAEFVCGPYVWGRYDLLLLPQSFPYGGMENPMLTFVTPTLLAGDRSLANVVAHEIAHSWCGNLVTNSSWSDFFLNEGFTVFVERKIISRLFGSQRSGLKAWVGFNALKETIARLGPKHPFTRLCVPMTDVDPDDSFSIVPYEKGCSLLLYLESVVGVDKFQAFLKRYFEEFAYKCLSHEEMRSSFEEFCGVHEQIDWDAWFHKPGMPIVEPKFDTTLPELAMASAKTWRAHGADLTKHRGEENWPADVRVVLLEALLNQLNDQEPLDANILNSMDDLYGFSDTKNSEIRFRWISLCIRSFHDEFAIPNACEFLSQQGRMKFVRPLYRTMHSKGSKLARKVALDTFKQNRSCYHAIAAKMVAKDLGLV